MAHAVVEYEKLVERFTGDAAIVAGQMFGKACLKVNGKAFVAQQHDYVVFKLAGQSHADALGMPGSKLWDPSGKGRPMKEWVAVPVIQSPTFEALTTAAINYVRRSFT